MFIFNIHEAIILRSATHQNDVLVFRCAPTLPIKYDIPRKELESNTEDDNPPQQVPFTRLCVMRTLCICWKFSAVEVLAPLSNSGCAAQARVITSSRFRFPFIPARVSLSSFT